MATLYEKIVLACFGSLGIFMVVTFAVILAETNIVFSIFFLLSMVCIAACIILFINLVKKYLFVQNLLKIFSVLILFFIVNCFVNNWFNTLCYITTIIIGFGLLINLKNKFSKNIAEYKEYKNALDKFDFENALKILETAFNNPKNKRLKLDIFLKIREIANYLKQYEKIIQYEQCIQKTERLNNVDKVALLESTYVANIHLKNFNSLEVQRNIIYGLFNNEQYKNLMSLHFDFYEIYIMIEQNRLNEALNILEQNFEKYKTIATLPNLYSLYSEIYIKLNDIDNAKKHLKKAIALYNNDELYLSKMILINKLDKIE